MPLDRVKVAAAVQQLHSMLKKAELTHTDIMELMEASYQAGWFAATERDDVGDDAQGQADQQARLLMHVLCRWPKLKRP